MKLTKQLKAEIADVYEAFWGALFYADIDMYSLFLDEDYRLIGTTEQEFFFSKTEAVRFLKATADQLAGNLERRNSCHRFEIIENLVLITDQFDAYVLIDDKWSFYEKTRVTTLLQERKAGWKIIQQHFSFPDNKAGSGQTIGLEKITKENLQLKEAIRRRTIELELKNKELEIEFSLERVRAVAMGMKQPADMLEVCEVIARELISLGIGNIRNIQTAVIDVEKETYQNYEYYQVAREKLVTTVAYKEHPTIHAFVKRMVKDPEGFYARRMIGEGLKKWLKYQAKAGQFVDPTSTKAASLHYYFYSIGSGALGITTYAPLSKEAIGLFKRFRNVFQLAYARFIDIQQALAQAFEARIEASLEKVRAQALGMRKPEDLPDVCEVLFKELQSLGFAELRNAMVNIHNDANRTFVNYDYSDEIGKSITPLFYDIHPVIKKQIRQIRSADDAFSETVFKGKDLESWKSFRKSRGEKEDKRIKNSTALYYYFYSIGTGSIGISAFNQIAKEKQEVLKRFRNVFAFAYRRYLDVAQAEAQTREAQIEASLERVRSRAMAMHNSAELTEVALELRKQMGLLGQKDLEVCAIHLYDDDQSFESWSAMKVPGSANEILQTQARFPKKGIRIVDELMKNYNGGEKDYVIINDGVKSVEWFAVLKEYAAELHTSIVQAIGEIPVNKLRANWSVADFSGGALVMVTYGEPDPASRNLLRRSANVFEQAYIRFLDLVKAEAQTREAQIEAAVERVRAQSMAMHRASDLVRVNEELLSQLSRLNLSGLTGVSFYLVDEAGMVKVWDLSSPGNMSDANNYAFSYDPEKYPILGEFVGIWKAAEQDYFILDYPKEKLIQAVDELQHIAPDVAGQFRNAIESGALSHQWNPAGRLTNGILSIDLMQAPSADTKNIVLKMAGAFNLAYQRFLDLQKAEAQAREAQIEAALEKIRSRSMAMHSSSELREVIALVFDRLKELGLHFEGTGIQLFNRGARDSVLYVAAPNQISAPQLIDLPYDQEDFETSKLIRDIWRAREKKEHIFNNDYSFEEKNSYFRYVARHNSGQVIPPAVRQMQEEAPGYTASIAMENNSALWVDSWSGQKITTEEFDVVKRAAQVFEQTYIRFLDLKRAEAQAKEAQIEAALERVRSRSIGMQKSEELKDVIKVVYDQLVHLNIKLDHAGFVVEYQPKADWHFWIADKQEIPSKITHPYFESVWATQFNNAKEKGEELFVTNLNFEEKNQFYNELLSYVPGLPQASRDFYLSCPALAASTVLLENVGLYIENFEGVPYSDDENMILLRFGKVFQQTYTRFLDLKKAEAQAKEAQIEAALEKVRSRTMAMQSSNELQETAAVLFNEFKKLGADNVYQVTIGIYNEEEGLIDFRVTSWADSGAQENRSFKLDMNEPTVLKPAVDAWKANKKSLVIDLSGETLEGWLNYRNKMSGIAISSADTAGRRVITVAYYSKGHLSISTPLPVPAETQRILERFAAVFDSTYTRFLDLEKAEAQVREAQIEAALERVRSRTLAMQKSDELAETAAVLFQQLITLGIEPNRLYISIIKGAQGETEFWITDEDGSKVSTAFSANMQENATFLKMYEGWKQHQKSLVIDLEGEELQKYFRHLTALGVPFKGGLEQKRRVQEIAYFSNGFIGMASPEEQPAETMELLERFAAVFNLTFTRFNDLKIAEAHALQAALDLVAIKEAKLKAEEALSVLQATQKQLVQSEKMASLGELTAGIAHEIQNPLNFVNNFSEVSKELLDEMREAIEKGDTEEAKEIMNDVIQNLEKINHHGKRADGIVKGMLQHSRSSSGVKEPTDINALADEYLRLAYHGLRAKDKSFNASLKTEYDETIGTINIIPQDIGRVILNLITNAFYAVDEKKKGQPDGYEPAVTVSTKKLNTSSGLAGVMIIVKDNGNGVPQQVIDKIFQPFFTTKPTGQGTGLGLSLSYDIVKAHGGELKVETKEGEGTSFILELPVV